MKASGALRPCLRLAVLVASADAFMLPSLLPRTRPVAAKMVDNEVYIEDN